MPLPADVLVADELSSDGAARLRSEFQAVGLTAELREVSPRRAVSDFAWLVLAVLPLQPFFDQLAKDSAADAYRRLKSLGRSVFGRSEKLTSGRPKVLLLQDAATGVQVVLEDDLPDGAYEQLLAFDLGSIRRGPLHYDHHRRQWRSELDEADDAASPSSA